MFTGLITVLLLLINIVTVELCLIMLFQYLHYLCYQKFIEKFVKMMHETM